MAAPALFTDIEACVDHVLSVVGDHIVLGIPLGIGKPNALVNAVYRRAQGDQRLHLEIFTALTLTVPKGHSLLEQRFLGPLRERLYAHYESLDYARDLHKGSLPPNIEVAEFYSAPGSYIGHPFAQRRHVCANYSQVARALFDRGVNVIAQAIACEEHEGKERLSLGSNADLTLDLGTKAPPGRRPFMVGHISPAMPFLPNSIDVSEGFFDAIIDEPVRADGSPLFPVPNQPVTLADYAIATHVTSLIADGGTLQIGIGSLADAISHVVQLRHTQNAIFRHLAERLITERHQALRPSLPTEYGRFEKGLYGCSEMLVEGLLDLAQSGVLKRFVPACGNPSRPIVLHAAFFLGSNALYRKLRELPDDLRSAIEMAGVSFVNTLDDDFVSKCAQRRGARFINSAMMVTLDGAAVSDSLEGKRLVSGVGGQQDFVAMAQHLPDARSIIVLPGTRTHAGRTQSNIVFAYPHTTIPRQFRDIVVTEYGAASLRGASDRDVMVRLLGIVDSRFQPGLLEKAKAAGMIESGYVIPDGLRQNTPAHIEERFSQELRQHLPHFPISTDFTLEEARAAIALKYLKMYAQSKASLIRLALLRTPVNENSAGVLTRMGLLSPRGLNERFNRRLLCAALARIDDSRPLHKS